MKIVKIRYGLDEVPTSDYVGIRIVDDGVPKFEVRLSGTAAAVMEANKEVYGDIYDWLEQVALAINSTGEVVSYCFIYIDSTQIGDKFTVIKNWRKYIK